jgi:hypothetical protein
MIPFKKLIELIEKAMFKRYEPFRVSSSTRRTSGNWTLFSAIADTEGWPFITT